MKKVFLLSVILLSSTLVAKDSFGCQVAVKQYNRQAKEMKRATEIGDRSQFKASCFWAISSLKSIYIKCDQWDVSKLENIKDSLEHYKKIHKKMTLEDGY